MKIFIYLLFYFISILSIIIGCIGSYFFTILFTIPFLPNLEVSSRLIKDYGLIGILLFGIPLFIFIFQIGQDLNYQIIHKFGFWARAAPKSSYRGFTVPDFYKPSLYDQVSREKIKKAKYRFRLFSISSWSIATLVAEAFLICCVVMAQQYNIKIQPIIVFILMLLVIWLFFYLWGRLQKRLYLEIAYVENEREFLCKKEPKKVGSKYDYSYTSSKVIKK